MFWFMTQQDVHEHGVQYESVIVISVLSVWICYLSASRVSLHITDVDVKCVPLFRTIIPCGFCATQFTLHLMKLTSTACYHFC